jgi:hypothetical protein
MTDFGVGKRSEAVVGPVGCLRFVRATYKEETGFDEYTSQELTLSKWRSGRNYLVKEETGVPSSHRGGRAAMEKY